MRWWWLAAVGAGLVLVACTPPPAQQFFVVDTTVDTVDVNPGDGICADAGGACSLRAAVMEANADPGITEVQLTGGETYTLALVGQGEDSAATGDLDIHERIYIRTTVGPGQATIDGGSIDRLLDVHAGDFHYVEGVVLTGGQTTAGGDGGAILARAGLVAIEDVRVTANQAAGSGGGIAEVGATLWLEDSAIDNNTASVAGGGVSIGRFARLFQTTVTANTAGSVDAQVAVGGGELQLASATVSGAATSLDLVGGDATVTSSILDAPTTCVIDSGFGSVISGGHNVSTDGACGLTGTGDQQNTDPGLAALADNGGPVPTQVPAPDSPAIDTTPCPGDTAPDARQQPRPSGSACDSGAVENQPAETLGADCTDPPNLVPGAQLQHCDLSGVLFPFGDLTGANLVGADLTGALLFAATLGGADLTDAAVVGADLRSILLNNATLVRTDFTGADFSGAGRLIGADLSAAKLTNADLSESVFLTGSTLAGTDFTGANLDEVRSGGIVGTPLVLPPSWQLVSGHLVGPGADLFQAGLSGVDLAGADLSDANLTGADLSSANLSAADLTIVSAGGADFSGADLTSADLSTGSFSNADLSGANLSGAYLGHASLLGVDVSGADFTGATLTRVRSGGIDGTPLVLPPSWQILNGHLIGPMANLDDAALAGVDLTGATLTHVWFTDADLTGAVLVGADLTGSLLNGTNLTDADLTNADLSTTSRNGTIWSNTACPDGTNSDNNGGTCEGHL